MRVAIKLSAQIFITFLMVFSTAPSALILGIGTSLFYGRGEGQPGSAFAASAASTQAKDPSVAVEVPGAVIPEGTLKTFEAYVAGYRSGVGIPGLEYEHGPQTVPGKVGVDFFIPNEHLAYFSQHGVKSIRLPFRWERLQPDLSGPLDPVYLGYIQTFIDDAISNGQRVLIDPHNYGARYVDGTLHGIGTPEVPIEAFADLWRQLALALRGRGQGLIGFDIMNEPNPKYITTPQSWVASAQAAIDAIRTVDAGTFIFVEGWRFSNPYNWADDNPTLHTLTDGSERLVFSMHQYFDEDKTGTYDSADRSYQGEGGNLTRSMDDLRKYLSWLQIHGFRGHVGEFGAPNRQDWLETTGIYIEALHDAGIPFHMWGAFGSESDNALNLTPDPNGVEKSQTIQLFEHL